MKKRNFKNFDFISIRVLEKEKNNRGITLVALVVTIVVLLILAGVSINLVLGQNGLISNTKEAKEKTKVAEKEEKTAIDDASDFISEIVNETKLPTTGTTKPYMPSSEFIKVEGTNLANGLVIQDVDGNQYVWVEVPMTEEVYPTAKLNITNFNDETYTKIENDLHNYTMSYRKGKNTTETTGKDEYCADANNQSDWFSGEDEYNTLKNKMLKSVYQNGGFWVARYEAGLDEENYRTASTPEPTVKPQSKPNLYPYTWTTRSQAKKIAEMVKYTNNGTTYTGSLMFGVQWDLVLAFMNKKGNISENDLNIESKNIGNYYDAKYILNRGKYSKIKELSNWHKYTENLDDIVKDCVKEAKEEQKDSILLTTGASDNNKIMNIYDIAGNQWEWTLESLIGEQNKYCISRGGCFGDYGARYPASYRYGDNTKYSSSTVTFRIVLG